MKKLNDIRRQIGPSLQKIEQERQDTLEQISAAKKWYIIPLLLSLFAVGSFFLEALFFAIALTFCAIVGFIIIGIYKIASLKTNYIENFKKGFFSIFLEALYPQVYYAPDNYLPSSLFDKSKLFSSYDNYSGEDYFEGKTESGCSFKFSELDITKTTRDSDGNTEEITVFDGLFFVLNVPNHVNGRIQVLPDTAESIFGNAGKFLQKNLGAFFRQSTMVYMEEHPEFEKEFVVYSEQEEDVYRILSANLLQAIYDLRYKWNTRLKISFIDHQMYVAMPTNKDFFHPNLKRSVLEDKLLEELYDELALCFAVVEDLSLEQEPNENRTMLNSNPKGVKFNHSNSKDNPFLL